MDVFAAIIVFAAALGAVLGSFGNVLIFRVPANRTIGGRSACPRCGRTLGLWELVPVLSFLALGGRCRSCHKPISWQYPVIETLSACIGVLAVVLVPSLPVAFVLGLCLWLLLLLAVIDGRTGMVPDALSVPFIALCILFAVLRAPTMPEFINLAWAVAIGAGFFGVQWIISRGRWVGSGDIFLGAGIGALLGSPSFTIVSIGISYIIGALVATVLLSIRKKSLASNLAFGPFLACGGFVTFLWGEDILHILRIF